jgi:hypothetical protein
MIEFNERIKVEAAVTSFKIISRYSSGGTERSHEILYVIDVMTAPKRTDLE